MNEEQQREYREKLETARKRHPLYQKNITRFTETWPEWKEGFAEAKICAELIGLLHRGFDADTKNWEEKRELICFYLEVAYGYNDDFLFRRPLGINYPDEERRLAELKQKIARKAWAMLCQNFFKENNPDWIYAYDPMILDRITWFFSETANIPRHNSENHHDIIALKFLAELSTLAWEGKLGKPESCFVAKRPLFIKILDAIKRLNILRKYWRELSPDDLISLEEIALEDGRYNTLAQAAINGSRAAQTAIVLKAMITERDRQKKIEEAELEIEEAQQKLKSLSE